MMFYKFGFDNNDYQSYGSKVYERFYFNSLTGNNGVSAYSSYITNGQDKRNIALDGLLSKYNAKLGSFGISYRIKDNLLIRFSVGSLEYNVLYFIGKKEQWIAATDGATDLEVTGQFRQPSSTLLGREEYTPQFQFILTNGNSVKGNKFRISFTDGTKKDVDGLKFYEKTKGG